MHVNFVLVFPLFVRQNNSCVFDYPALSRRDPQKGKLGDKEAMSWGDGFRTSCLKHCD